MIYTVTMIFGYHLTDCAPLMMVNNVKSGDSVVYLVMDTWTEVGRLKTFTRAGFISYINALFKTESYIFKGNRNIEV